MAEGNDPQETAVPDVPDAPKYEHPKILLMDLPDDVEQSLRQAGYRVTTGTFGSPVRVAKDAEHLALPPGVAPPNDTEQEIVILDSAAPGAIVKELKEPVEGEPSFWQSAISGVIDPRPLAMTVLRARSFDRILNHGGVFICFIDHRESIDYLFATLRYRALEDQEPSPLSTWNFLSVMDEVQSKRDRGTEFSLTSLGEKLPGLKAALRDAEFHCTMDGGFTLEDTWVPLATNKYGGTVAAVVMGDDERKGFIFLLPRIKNKAALVTRFVSEFLPRFAGQFYPHIQRSDWVREPPYELPEVLALQQDTAAVEAKAASEVKALEEKIQAKREERSFVYELLIATDAELVTAVKETLEMLGLNDVRDVDEEAEDKAVRREDLQVWDRSPTLLIEVKGITGLPKEAYSLQVDKYVAPRIKEWGRIDVQGLTIINHQMGKMGLEREGENVFQDAVITNAEAREFGLLTTWELFRLARGYLRHNWKPEHVVDLFYRHGVIEPIPSHYQLVGKVNQFFEKAEALTVDLEQPIRVGDTLAYELAIEFEEEEIGSLRLNDETVAEAEAGAEIGVKTALSKEQARKGVRVYKVVGD